MSTLALPLAPAKATRARDAMIVLGLATLATFAICSLQRSPAELALVMIAILALLLLRWHAPRDLIGLSVGTCFGNATETVSALGGVWVHSRPSILDVLPPYILVCYPILGAALPRLVDAIVGRARVDRGGALETLPVRDRLFAAVVWATHVGLSFRYGTTNEAELVVSLACLGVTLSRFHTRHDLATAILGALLGLVWEVPCTWTGAWHFPAPQLFGLLPAWLPFAYATFFVNLGRLSMPFPRSDQE